MYAHGVEPVGRSVDNKSMDASEREMKRRIKVVWHIRDPVACADASKQP